jgi:hypothetical protein
MCLQLSAPILLDRKVICSRIIGYYPLDLRNWESIQRTRSLYEKIFEQPPPAEFWTNEDGDDIEEKDCSICLEKMPIDNDHNTAELECGHAFPFSCILRSFDRMQSCPICRQGVFKYVENEDAPIVKYVQIIVRLVFSSQYLRD